MAPRTLFLTGASSGIGRALALHYARSGTHMALAARRAPELERVAEEVDRRGGRAVCIPLDVTDPAAVSEAVHRAEHELGSLDMVIANAGVAVTRHAAMLRWDDVVDVVDVNVKGAIATLVAAIPILMAQRHGHLVGISSLAGRRGLPMAAAYSASKAALSTFLESIRLDLGPAGVRVTDVRPGFVLTPMNEASTFPTPFRWPVEKAAKVIAQRLERAPAVVSFPWQLTWLTSLARLLPVGIYEPLVRAQSR